MAPVTIVIPTYNRSHKIRETLDALAQQDFRDFSVIVVDDGSTDGSGDAIEKMLPSLPCPARLIRQSNRGASAATNAGVNAAPEGIVILFDDDIIPAPATVRRHAEFHAAHPGSILSGSADTDPARSTTDVQRYKLYMEQEWLRVRPLEEKPVAVTFGSFVITTANMSFPRNVFLELGGFDVALRDGYDVDFGFRALLKNIPLYFDRSIKSIHNDQISLRYYGRRQKAYMDSKRTIFERNPALREKIGDDGAVRVPVFKSIFYAILRSSFLVSFFESGMFAKLFPKPLRYKIYGSTIAAISLRP